MTHKCILHIVTSVDGFIADENGISEFSFAAVKADPEFKTFYDSVSSVVMGRKSYDRIKMNSGNLFKDKDVYVITHYLRQKEENITFVQENIMGLVQNLKKQGKGHIWLLGGAEITNILLKEKQIDEIILTQAPFLLGQGTRLFKDDNPTEKLVLEGVRTFGDYVQTHYRLK